MAHDEVNEQNVYICTGQPLPTDIANIVEWMLNEDFVTAYQSEWCHLSRYATAFSLYFPCDAVLRRLAYLYIYNCGKAVLSVCVGLNTGFLL